MTSLEHLGAALADDLPVPEAARALLEFHVIDTLGACIASTATPEGQALLGFRTAMRQRAGASLLELDLSTRCALARLSEIDDIHLASMTTPGAVVIPAALTIAAAMPVVRTDQLYPAILAGYAAMIRLGRAIDGPSVLYRGIWPTYFATPFAVAAVAARLFRLDARQTAHALALALSLAAPGVGHHSAPTTSRWLAVGHAARTGLAAASAAQAGFTSDLDLLDGPFLPRVYEIKPALAALITGPGPHAALAQVSFKPWCAARQTMAATQALKEIIEEGVAPASITTIEVAALPPHHRMIDHGVTPGDRAAHLTSVQYAMAMAALAPDRAAGELAGAQQPTPPAVAAFMEKITVEPDTSLLADYPQRWPARVRVTAAKNRHERLVTSVPGDPDRPFDRAQVEKKFLAFVGRAVGASQAGQILARCRERFATGDLVSLTTDLDALL